MVNFVSLFCPKLQKLLKPIYDLTRKGRQFLWEKEQQQAFDEIKHRLQRPPVLHLPDRHGHFQLYSDTSKFTTGSALYQIQNGQPKLIAYASKRMPEAAKNYSITELEMCGLAMNIATFLHLLKKVDFVLCQGSMWIRSSLYPRGNNCIALCNTQAQVYSLHQGGITKGCSNNYNSESLTLYLHLLTLHNCSKEGLLFTFPLLYLQNSISLKLIWTNIS